MAEACQPKENTYEAICSSKRHSDISKQDCTSPSPTETVCIIDSACSDRIPGKFGFTMPFYSIENYVIQF